MYEHRLPVLFHGRCQDEVDHARREAELHFPAGDEPRHERARKGAWVPASGAFLQQAGALRSGREDRTLYFPNHRKLFAPARFRHERIASGTEREPVDHARMPKRRHVGVSDARGERLRHRIGCHTFQGMPEHADPLRPSDERRGERPRSGWCASFVKTTVPASTASTIWRRRDFSIGRFCAPTTRCS